MLFERLQVDEPEIFLEKNKIYADVLVQITDKVLAGKVVEMIHQRFALKVLSDIAAKKISIDDAIINKLFKVYGDAEIWKLQLDALKEILPGEHFEPRKAENPKVEETDEEVPELMINEWTDYSNLPQTDLSDIDAEFKLLTDHFAALRHKYSTKKVSFQDEAQKE